ncbi:Conserved hypothetical protein [Micromonospora lupini str. Lupac 08]|uniref:Uncharacterized protein n=1 Tax=Micromonospora lupini str. Lupac 08 TaxID=1150864 RepID=I0L4I1_9ACTN|nr:Conserved hypothetical protein [Micromonospora lupini str. Lupac 08]
MADVTSPAANCSTCGRPRLPLIYTEHDGQPEHACPERHAEPTRGEPGAVPAVAPDGHDERVPATSGYPVRTSDGRSWRIGTAGDIDWIAGHTTPGLSVTAAIPPVFDAYATFHPPGGVSLEAHELAVVRELATATPEQPWWLGYLDTGAHDVVFPRAAKVSIYEGWSYVLVEAGPEQTLTWRTGHLRGDGALPDLFFPADRSWLVSALWDDTWTDVGGSTLVLAGLRRNPLVNARLVGPDEDACPPGLTRD